MKQLLFYMLVIFAAKSVAGQNDSATGYKPVNLPAGFTARLNTVYVEVEGWQGKMDLYLPSVGGPSPVVINIHGGGWNHGTKESQTGFSTFFKAGYAVANIEYRLTPQAKAPAAIQDARCALIYLVEHARELNIDPGKIVVMGSSAGGHLALMTGLLGSDARFDANCATRQKIKVAAIINKYGIADVWDWGYGPVIKSKSATGWLGNRAGDEAFAKSVSPVNYINKNSPPVFIVHGDADPTVPYQQSVDLHRQLHAAGVPVQFITVKGGLHGKFSEEDNMQVNKEISAFLKKYVL